jgi:TPP-dependent 2-oxoacid decarboxylase
MSHPTGWTVARYLATRLEQLGVHRIFGVPGNHLGPFLSIMRETTSVEWVGTPTEMGAGYAADGYARVHGVGAAAVTYSVGAFSLLNTIGGAYVEEIPLVAINASPTYEQWLNFRAVGLLTSHMSPRFESNLDVYRQVTVDAQVISNAALAPAQIDAALTACLSERQPVYLEVMENVWSTECPAPQGEIVPRPRPTTAGNLRTLARAVEASIALIDAHERRPILWGGEEIDRYRLADTFESLVDKTGIPFCTTIGGKSILSETHPQFHGVYNGNASLPEVRRIFKEVAKCRIGLGSWSTSKNLAGDKVIGSDWIVAARQGVSVGAQYFPDVKLEEYMAALRDAAVAKWGEGCFRTDYYADAAEPGDEHPDTRGEFLAALRAPSPPARPLTYDSFFAAIGDFLTDTASGETSPYVVVSDAGFALLGSMNLPMVERRSYFAQNAWLSIGYSVGAVTGVKSALATRRPLVFVGDGSFQEICQELSTHTRLGQDVVVFVLNNGDFYGIEQMLVHPCFYKGDSEPDPAFYNELHPWRFAKLAEVFASADKPMGGVEIATHADLHALLARLTDAADPLNRGPVLVQVRLPRRDFPRAIGYQTAGCP